MRHEDADAADRELESDSFDSLDNSIEHFALQRSEDESLEGNSENGFAVVVNDSVLDLFDFEDRDEVAVLDRAGAQKGVESG